MQNSTADIVYVASSADFGKYRRLMPEDMGIFYPTKAPPSEADLERMQNAFRRAFIEQVAGYEIVDRPAKDVMKVRASLVDLRHASANDLPNLGADLNRILEPGKLTFLVEMRDSVTDDLLLRAADTEKSPDIDLPEGVSTTPDEIQAAANYWAKLFRSFLDRNFGVEHQKAVE